MIRSVFIFTLIVLSACAKCKKEVPEYCATIDISDEYNPVCGCDGKTYHNKAHAECIGGITNYTEGDCKGDGK